MPPSRPVGTGLPTESLCTATKSLAHKALQHCPELKATGRLVRGQPEFGGQIHQETSLEWRRGLLTSKATQVSLLTYKATVSVATSYLQESLYLSITSDRGVSRVVPYHPGTVLTELRRSEWNSFSHLLEECIYPRPVCA